MIRSIASIARRRAGAIPSAISSQTNTNIRIHAFPTVVSNENTTTTTTTTTTANSPPSSSFSTSTSTSTSTTPNLTNNKVPLFNVIPKEDFGDFAEYSVIFTNRALNLMSDPFQRVMRDLNLLLKETYNARKVAIIPGSGTFGMEAVARQFATNENVMVIRNGWFSYRWTEIFDMGTANEKNHSIPSSHTVLKAQPTTSTTTTTTPSSPSLTDQANIQYAPYPIEEVVKKIKEERPSVVFAPHVETSTGMILPDDYIQQAAKAVHEVGGMFVLDCIASGTVWVDMKELGIDIVISAPQKGWTGPSCAALVMMSEHAVEKMNETDETSFSMSLRRWSAIMDTYEKGGFGYHTTMPTDALRDFHEISVETMKIGMPELKAAQLELGRRAREVFDSKGLVSVAAPGFQAPGVLVFYSPAGIENPAMMTKFKSQGLQIAMGVPWRIDEPEGLKTFRMGLFGLDKLGDIDKTVAVMEEALDHVLMDCGHSMEETA